MATRTLPEKVGDIKTTYAQFQELLTSPEQRAILSNMTGAMSKAGEEAGDINAYANLVSASLSLHRVVAANDRAALMAAVMANSGNTRVLPVEED